MECLDAHTGQVSPGVCELRSELELPDFPEYRGGANQARKEKRTQDSKKRKKKKEEKERALHGV